MQLIHSTATFVLVFCVLYTPSDYLARLEQSRHAAVTHESFLSPQ